MAYVDLTLVIKKLVLTMFSTKHKYSQNIKKEGIHQPRHENVTQLSIADLLLFVSLVFVSLFTGTQTFFRE